MRKFPDALVEGETLWVTGNGVSLRLSTQTWDVLAWVPRAQLPDGERLEQALTTPGGRFQWLFVEDEFRTSRLRIVDLERAPVS